METKAKNALMIVALLLVVGGALAMLKLNQPETTQEDWTKDLYCDTYGQEQALAGGDNQLSNSYLRYDLISNQTEGNQEQITYQFNHSRNYAEPYEFQYTELCFAYRTNGNIVEQGLLQSGKEYKHPNQETYIEFIDTNGNNIIDTGDLIKHTFLRNDNSRYALPELAQEGYEPVALLMNGA